MTDDITLFFCLRKSGIYYKNMSNFIIVFPNINALKYCKKNRLIE